MNTLLIILTFIFGAAIGSFLNVVILRLPEEEKLTGRSHCNSCGHTLGVLDLVPIFSFVFLGGRCRFCKAKFSARYAIIETITGLLFAFSWAHLKPMDLSSFLQLFRFWFMSASLLVVFVVDLEHYIILDQVIFPGWVILALLNLSLDLASGKPFWNLDSHFVLGIAAALAITLPFFLVWYLSKGKWMGFGDVKLAVFLGLGLGWPLVFPGLMIAVLCGGFVSAILLASTSKTLKSQVPFGTFLSFGAIVALFYGQSLISWYLALLGF